MGPTLLKSQTAIGLVKAEGLEVRGFRQSVVGFWFSSGKNLYQLQPL